MLSRILAEATGRRLVAWPFEALGSGQRVRWRVAPRRGSRRMPLVRVRGVRGRVCSTTTGSAQWISPVEARVGSDDDPGYGRRAAHVLAGAFTVAGAVVTARLYTTALGVYTATVNGERVGHGRARAGFDVVRPHALRAGSRRHGPRPRRRQHDRDRAVRRLVPRPGRRVPAARRMGHDARRAGGTAPRVRRRHPAGRAQRRDAGRARRSAITRADLMDGQTARLLARRARPSAVRCSSTSSTRRRSTGRPRRRSASSRRARPSSFASSPTARGSRTSARTPPAGSD